MQIKLWLFPNETELEGISGFLVNDIDQIKKAALSLVEKGIRQAIVTMGKKGSLFVNKESIVHVPPKMVIPKYTTEAYDAFIGCFAYYLIKKIIPKIIP